MKYYGDREQDYRDAKWRRLNRIEKAAPDLLSALIELERVESSPHSETVRYLARENAREAIRKAKGEA